MKTTRVGIALCVVLFLSATLGVSATIAPGEVRTAQGSLAGVDVANRSVVIEVPGSKAFVVGVTLKEGVTPTSDGKPVSLSDLPVGKNALLKYTREGDRLVGMELKIKP